MRWTQYVVHLICILFLSLQCQVSTRTRHLEAEDVVFQPRQKKTMALSRGNYEDYVPIPNRPNLQPLRTLRVNVHFMNDGKGTMNYGPETAPAFAHSLIKGANAHLSSNHKMWLPRGNDTPVLPINFRLQLTPSKGHEEAGGVYCHNDDEHYFFISRGRNRNNYDRTVIQQYGVGLDSILNIFVMPHHPDSISSSSYSVTSAGISLGSAVKIAGIFETGKQAYSFRGLLNHEIGHVLGLRHTWSGNDGCQDTPNHPNCWNLSTQAPCDSLASNNLMDYNAKQHAWTPCQIGKIHQGFAREGSKGRNLLVRDWCKPKIDGDVEVNNQETWTGAKDIAGDIIIKPGGHLVIRNRVSIPHQGKILVEPGGKLEVHAVKLHNACGYIWQGIQVISKKSLQGDVVFHGEPIFENISQTALQSLRRSSQSDN